MKLSKEAFSQVPRASPRFRCSGRSRASPGPMCCAVRAFFVRFTVVLRVLKKRVSALLTTKTTHKADCTQVQEISQTPKLLGFFISFVILSFNP